MEEKSLILKKMLKGKFSVFKDQNLFTNLKKINHGKRGKHRIKEMVKKNGKGNMETILPYFLPYLRGYKVSA